MTGVQTCALPISLATTAVERYSLPLDLGVAQSFDLQKILSTVKGVHDVSASTIPLNLSISSGALFIDESGVSFIGTLLSVSPDLFAATVQELRNLATSSAAPASCTECQLTSKTVSISLGIAQASFSVPDLDTFNRCQSEKAACELRKKLPAAKGSNAQPLTPLQTFVLRRLASSANVDDRQLYALVADRLKPSISLAFPKTDVKEEDFNREYAALQSQFTAARLRVANDASLSGNESLTAIRRDFLGSVVSESVTPVKVSAKISVPAQDQPYDQTIRTDPAPNLNCGNQRQCKSDFQYDGFNPPGCPASCTHMECFLGMCTEIPDLGLCARKTACEADKAGQKLDYERRKAQAQAQFALEKADCERLKATERLGCEINQQWLNTTQSMDLGNIKGSAHIGAVDGAVSVKSVKVSGNLDAIEVVFDATAQSQVETAFTFTPLNVGHIACVAQWNGKVSANVILNQTDYVLRAHVRTAQPNGDGPSYGTDEGEVTLRSTPPLGLALLAQNPQMVLACPIPAAIAAALAGVSPVGLLVEIKLLLNDEVKIKIAAQDVPLTIRDDDSNREGVHVGVKMRMAPEALVAFMTPHGA